MGVTLMNYTPGNTSNADVTTHYLKSYHWSNQTDDLIVEH